MKKASDTENAYRLYLVTNHHVLEDIERIESQNIAEVTKTRAVLEPATMVLPFNPKATGRAQEFSAPVHNPDPKIDWIQDKNTDLAITGIDPGILDKSGIQYSAFQSDSHVADKSKATEVGLTEGDAIYVLGFPMGLVGGERNYVISRQGVIARIRDFLAGISTRFLIDSLIFPGNSGGPVVTRSEVSSIQGTKSQNRSDTAASTPPPAIPGSA